MGILSKARDAAIQQAILRVVGPRFERYGEARQFKIDTSAQTFSAEVWLRGEASTLSVTEGHYRIEEEAGQSHIVLHGLRVSREWAQRILDDHFPEIRLKAPGFIKSLL